MATKAEVKAIKKEIAEHRELQPEMANGLILALAIVNDEHEPKYISVPELMVLDPVDGSIAKVTTKSVMIEKSFAYALNEMENNGNKVYQTGFKETILSFEKGKFILTSDIRGREVLTEFPFSMVNAKNWVIYEPS
jgi:hypothetical protein